jgi:phosphatidylinositol glycan class O
LNRTLHVIGLYLFTSGFLLTRLVLDDRSECANPPLELDNNITVGDGCWHPKTFNKAVLIVIDALRYDFTVPFQPKDLEDLPRSYHDSFPVLYEIAEQQPQNAVLLPFIADPPTTTLQRLKGLTTGTLPTFIDAGSNFAGEAIDEDNLVEQLRHANKTVVHLGDDTWHALFPGYFDKELTRPYDSFNVWDLHTVDNGVITHLIPLLDKQNVTKWDFLIGHLLGVDHAGHRYGPDHPAMTAKLRQMDGFIRDTMEKIDDNTLLVVLGDHGMDSKGDHGGESDDEVQAALWMYSKTPAFGRRMGKKTPLVATERPVAQIDLVPTLALLLGLPIPFNNLGSPIFEAFSGKAGDDYENLARVQRLAGGQIERYMKRYAQVQSLDVDVLERLKVVWHSANMLWSARANGNWRASHGRFAQYQQETLALCKELWALFNIPSMLHGIEILALALVILLLYSQIQVDVTNLTPTFVARGGGGLILGGAVGYLLGLYVPQFPLLSTTLYVAGLTASFGTFWSFFTFRKHLRFPLPRSVPAWMAVIFTIGLSAGFASNSYTIWEDRILVFFLATIGVGLFAVAMAQKKLEDRAWGCYHAILFAILTRVASFSRLCREEQMPYCISTYYSSSSSSTSAAWHLIVPITVAFALPGIIKQYYQSTQSYHHSAVLWYGIIFRLGLWMSATYWVLNTADDHDWWDISDQPWVKTVKVMLAQTVLGVIVAVGYSVYGWSAPFMAISDGSQAISVQGYSNVHGTRYFPLVTLWAGATIFLSKPLGAGAVAGMLWQILCLVEVISIPSIRNSAIGPVALGLLGCFHFFTTGHQAVLSSIQWDAAFIPLHTIRQPWSAIVVILNTWGPPFLGGIAVPLLSLWKAPAREKGLLSNVAKNTAIHLAFYTALALATAMWAGHLRRHLMLFRIFCPRYLLAGVTLVIVDIGTVFVGLLGSRWSFLSVGQVFGEYG